MKIRFYAVVVAMLLAGFMHSSNAQGPGEMRAEGYLPGAGHGFGSGHVQIIYYLTFKLANDSDGVYPAAERVEIEFPGELNPDGSESSSFVISIPAGAFQEGPTGIYWTWNPSGLTVCQRYESYVWDFVGPAGVQRDASSGVRGFWASIRLRDFDEVASAKIWMMIKDNRYESAPAEPAPKFFDLLIGGPTLRIGNDGWETEIYSVWPASLKSKPYSPQD